MTRIWLSSLYLLAALCVALPAFAAPQKVVSLNLCTDQLAATMLPKERLKGVSFNAVDPALSLVSRSAVDFPALKGTIEEMASIMPDHVLMGEGQNTRLQHWLEEKQIPVTTIGMPDSVPALQRDIDKLAKAMGTSTQANVLKARQMATLKQAKLPRKGMKIAIYYPRGFSDGKGTLLHDLITRMGGVNVAGEQGQEGMAYLSLEELVTLNPDVLVVPLYDYDVVSQAEALAEHPALQNMTSLIVPLPGQYLTCPHLGMEAVVNTIIARVYDAERKASAKAKSGGV